MDSGLALRAPRNDEASPAGSRLRLLQGRNAAHIHLPLRMPGIVSRLQAKPDRRSVADQLADPRGHVGADRLPLLKDFVKMLAGNSEQPRDLGLRLAQRRHDVIKHRAGVRRAAIGITPRLVRGHWDGLRYARAMMAPVDSL